MKRQNVQSSNISSIGYDSVSRTLEVQFNTGSIYQYYGVPETLYRGLMNANSHGTYLNQYIKKRFRYKQIS